MVIVVILFKQKTAYEMRISDWISDVCSSDLGWRDDIISRQRILCVRQGNLDDFRARVLHPCNALLPQRLDLSRHSVNAILFRNTDAFAFEIAVKACFPLRTWQVQRRRIARIEASRSEEHTSELQSLM